MTNNNKIQIIKELNKGVSDKQLAETFEVGTSTI